MYKFQKCRILEWNHCYCQIGN